MGVKGWMWRVKIKIWRLSRLKCGKKRKNVKFFWVSNVDDVCIPFKTTVFPFPIDLKCMIMWCKVDILTQQLMAFHFMLIPHVIFKHYTLAPGLKNPACRLTWGQHANRAALHWPREPGSPAEVRHTDGVIGLHFRQSRRYRQKLLQASHA